jgi:hypothetical protein
LQYSVSWHVDRVTNTPFVDTGPGSLAEIQQGFGGNFSPSPIFFGFLINIGIGLLNYTAPHYRG